MCTQQGKEQAYVCICKCVQERYVRLPENLPEKNMQSSPPEKKGKGTCENGKKPRKNYVNYKKKTKNIKNDKK